MNNAQIVLPEDVNPLTDDIDILDTATVLRRINEEDSSVPQAAARVLPEVEQVTERVIAAFRAGGRLIYVGAGTSGRLAALDAAECPPTYGVDPRQIQAIIAGGPATMTASVEGAEDDEDQGSRDLAAREVGERDVVLGIVASGRTPYMVGALRRARALGACTAALVGNPRGPVAETADLVIAPDTGSEVVAGSTRMKAGTAQKMILTMISTTTMIRTGHTFHNLMVGMHAGNSKLRGRALRMISQATGADGETARRALDAADGQIKTAIVMLTDRTTAAQARERLARADGVVRKALRNGS
jgi:N-acetylmuramic acid 6-phosphate etherase